VNAIRLGLWIRILGAHDDAGVGGFLAVQADEVAPIERQHDAAVVCCVGEDLLIRNSLPALPASNAVTTSCPFVRNARTTGSGKFSSP
jgi:hypothetical protein